MRKIILSILTFLAAGLLIIAIIVPDRNKMNQNQSDSNQTSYDSEETIENGNGDGQKSGDNIMDGTGSESFETEEDFFDSEDSDHETQAHDVPYSVEPPNGVYIPDENTSGSEMNSENGNEGDSSNSSGPGGEFETEEDPL